MNGQVKPEVGEPGKRRTLNVERRFRVQGSGFRVQGSGFRVRGSGFRVRGSGFRVQGSGFGVRGSGFEVRGSGSRFEVRGSRFEVRGSRFGVRGSGFGVRGSGSARFGAHRAPLQGRRGRQARAASGKTAPGAPLLQRSVAAGALEDWAGGVERLLPDQCR